jgi:1-deoxy-D-xylulose-5-phosphate reductoisomerase
MYNKKTIAILGSTGSIGENTIRIVKQYPEVFKVKALTAHSNVDLLAKQALELQPEYVHITDTSKIPELKNLLSSSKIKIISEIAEISSIKVDLSVIAIVGSAAIMPTINAIKAGNNIALANKECLVCAGTIITKLAKQKKVKIIPVDSEHSGLFQVFDHKNPHLIKDVILTASGGPFREYSLEQMQNVTKQQALKHPNWSMGAKITIDSASLVNKCLEVIEAHHLFPLKPEQIKILIHPESIVHAIANYTDGTMLAHLGAHNMQIPISFALFYPDRATLPEFNQFDLSNIGNLRFYKPDPVKFRSLQILNTILANIETNASLIFNMANEVAVEAFLQDKISFLQITEIIEKVLEQSKFKQLGSLEEVLDSMEHTKARASEFVFRPQKP